MGTYELTGYPSSLASKIDQTYCEDPLWDILNLRGPPSLNADKVAIPYLWLTSTNRRNNLRRIPRSGPALFSTQTPPPLLSYVRVPVDDSSIGQPFPYSAWNFVIERYNLSNTSLPLRRRPYAHLDLSTPVSVSHNRPSEGSAQGTS
ncbi:hypothetical protein RhiLY_05965 [Ceratobasidium sp. AG-Ba]|nr:hypothetical protein RhiLY_05965 [Ceratobasidium sp. AG-Ba]